MIDIRHVYKTFGDRHILKDVSLSIKDGETMVILGASGSGKSTLLNIIGGIDSADSGDICIKGARLADMSEKRLTLYRRNHLGYIFQMYNLIPNLTVRENIEVGAYLSDKPLDVDELLHTLGLYEHQRKLPNQLSGGQQQRVLLQAKELHLVLTCRHNLAIDHMCARLHAIVGTQRSKRLQRRSVKLAIDVRRRNKGAAALLLNQVAIGAQFLNGAAHRNAAHLVLFGKLKFGRDALLRCINTFLDCILDFVVNLLVKRCVFRCGHIGSLLSK